MGVKSYLRQKNMERKHRLAADAQIRKKANAEFFREKEQQEMRVARADAKARADRKIEGFKAKKQGFSMGGFGIGFDAGPALGGSASGSPVKFGKAPKRGKKRKAKRKRQTTQSYGLFDY